MEQKNITLTWEEWEAQFKPIQNHVTKREEFNGWLFETYGEDLNYIHGLEDSNEKYGEANIWTILDADEYSVCIGNGYHHVNRMGYFITEVPAEANVSYSVQDEDDRIWFDQYTGREVNKDEVISLSNEFSKTLVEWLTPAEIEEIIAKNEAEKDKSVCASHEYCDPNQAMIDAFQIAMNRELTLQDDDDIALTNAAWDLSKQNKFKTEA